ncbi:unnamed protein product [Leuciscus chuanchicus]
MRLHELLLKLVGNKETVERSGKQLFTCASPELVNAHKPRADENTTVTVGLSGLTHLSPSKRARLTGRAREGVKLIPTLTAETSEVIGHDPGNAKWCGRGQSYSLSDGWSPQYIRCQAPHDAFMLRRDASLSGPTKLSSALC